ncbi:MAG TPA: response regulator [Caldithrix sp.]|nr:response regulator [Caldithrix sp.]
MRVLVFETSKDRAKLIQDLLGNYRYKIFINFNSSISMSRIQEVKPSLIILNVNLRKHVELLEKLKNHSRLSKIPVILISNNSSREIIEKINQLPHVDYLIEPFKIKNFRHMVERWINFRSLYVN